MNNEYRYILETGSKKHRCPECGKRTFVFYIDTETGSHLPENYGRCDRESKCSYHLNPYLNGYSKMFWEQEQGNKTELPRDWKPQQRKPTPKAVYFDNEAFLQTLQPDRYEHNVFIENLLKRVKYPFNQANIEKVIALYYLGTVVNGYRAGAVTFPFIDIKGNVRAIQVKQFDETNHTTGTDFLHSIIEKHHIKNNMPLPEWLRLYIEQEKRISCLFGSHLLSKYPLNPVALVEAPKTAVYGTLYFGLPEHPKDFIWLAVYNKSSFSIDKMEALKGRDVFIFPDLSKDGNTFKEWHDKAKEYESRLPGTRFIFSDLLERYATNEQREQGADIADILIEMDWQQFRPKPEKVTEVTFVSPETNFILPTVDAKNRDYLKIPTLIPVPLPDTWSNEIAELEMFFARISRPATPIKLNSFSTITDINLFIDGHLATIKANNGKKSFLPYIIRLQELRQILSLN